MYLKDLYLRNFRNFRNAKFLFNKGVNAIIGANGTGKTNAFRALRLLLDDNLPRNAISLLESDFNRSLPSWKGHWIIISLHFEELTEDEPSKALVYHQIQCEPEKGSLNLYFRPSKTFRKDLFELSSIENFEDRRERVKERIEQININDYETVIFGKSSANYYDDDIYKQVVGDFDTFIFPDPDNQDANLIGIQSSIGYKNDFACTFAKALRDVVGEMRNNRTSPLQRLLSNVEIDNQNVEIVSSTIKELNTTIKNIPQIIDVSHGIADSLRRTAGFTYAPQVEINSNLSEDIGEALHSLSLQAGELNDNKYRGALNELSLGGANLIYLALKLEEYNRLDHNKRKIMHFLLIEEPEAHIHTHIQKTLFQKYRDHNHSTQIILSTHSSHISASCSLNQVNILIQEGNQTKVYQPTIGIDPVDVLKLERYLDATRSTLLFAKSVILVEGDAEMILIPIMIKKVFGLSLDELGISLINVGSTQFKNIANIFGPNRLSIKCAIITDYDKSIVPLEPGAYDDEDYQKKCRNSQVSGILRREKLDEFVADNEFLQAFYAEHTFEVEFLRAGNQEIITKVCGQIFEQEAAKNNSINKIRNPQVSVSGKEILRLAEAEGKGWLALLIADYIDKETKIPNYILEAIKFVADVKESHAIEMITYKMGKEAFGVFEKEVREQFLEEYSTKKLIEVYQERNPDNMIA